MNDAPSGQWPASPAFHFVIPGEPVPWARARGGSDFGGFYTPQRQRQYKATIGQYCRVAMMQAKARTIARDLPVWLCVRVFLPIAITWETKRPESYARAVAGWPCVERPDMDNWCKLPMDAMEGLAYADDAQIVCFDGSGKWFDPKRPRLEIEVRAWVA